MSISDELGHRMKDYYENISKTKLMKRMPVIIRVDGKAFHTFTRGFKRPFDEVLIKTMQETTKYLCQNIQGCVLGYTQSDEISLVLVDYQKLDTSAWFDYKVQKICSVAASMTTMAFNKGFVKNYLEYVKTTYPDFTNEKEMEIYRNYISAYTRAIDNGALFDARCFNIPKEEVANYIYWRQIDATRNSIQMVGQAYFSHKELHCKSCKDIQDMLITQKEINWNSLPTYHKRGTCVIKGYSDNTEAGYSSWIIDKNIPIFKGEDREYIDELIYVGE